MSTLLISKEWSEPEIEAALDSVAQGNLGYELKEWQRSGTANLLCGNDVLLLAETGAGKSTLFELYALARPEEIVIVVAPLKLIEQNMVAAARSEKRDIWEECASGEYRIIVCSPERLAGDEMDKLLANSDFRARVGLVVVDEAHLIPTWGKEFRRAFNAIGALKSQLESRTVFLALSATLMPGEPIEEVTRSLGLSGSRFCPLKLKCTRSNIHITLRRMMHAISTGTFKDLDWLVTNEKLNTEEDIFSIPKTIIYVDNVAQGYRLTLYLRTLLPPNLRPLGKQIIRHIHASTCSICKNEAYAEFSRISPPSLLSAHSWDLVKKQLGLLDRTSPKRAKKGDNTDTKEKVTMCKYFRKVLEAHLKGSCITQVLQKLYGDEGHESHCQLCSGCIPDVLQDSGSKTLHKNTQVLQPPERRSRVDLKVRRSAGRGPGRLTVEILAKARAMLSELVVDAWLSIPSDPATQFDGPDAFLSIEKQTLLLKHLRDLESHTQVQEILGDSWPYWSSHGEKFSVRILQIRATMIEGLFQNQARHRGELARKENMQLQEDVESEIDSDNDTDSIDIPLKNAEMVVESCNHPAMHHPERLIIRLRRPANAPVFQPIE
ncbi:DEAD/DEAH box helicase [Ceratobasidium sp. AG-Ba]|nr:DEAD/DEAH box helicase [Ceratobasidium sp. AG-Ba]QRW14132.1 DEAD/DEAH box helicase [Ceratobasidium sp. AG-Ba]